MNCEQASQCIKPFIDGSISHTQLSDYLGHIGQCRECYEELDIMFIVAEGLNGLHTDEVRNFDFTGMLAGRIEQSRQYLKRMAFRRICFLSVDTVAYFALGLLLLRMFGIWQW